MLKSPKGLLACVLIFTACGQSESAELRRAIGSGESSDIAETCSGRVIVTRDGPCRTSAPGWTARRLFGPEVERLAGYCSYEWTGDGEPVGRPFARDVDPRERDCLAVSGLAGPAAGGVDLESRFLTHAGALATLPAPTDPAAQPVRVAVIDSARDLAVPGVGGGNSAHGRSVGLVISRLGCPAGSPCLAEVDNFLALRVMRTPTGLTRDPNGGFFGYQSDVASAIFAAVAANAGRKLVVNLSLGWDEAFGSDAAARVSVEAVYEALRYARCRGALVVAASGNSRGQLPPSDGPLLPAAWQAVPAPTPAQCLADFGISSATSGPLLYAASGLDDKDQLLINTPLGARAPLAAPALQVVISDPTRPPNVPAALPRSGSSMGAAVVSAAAALAWAYAPPGRPLDEIMQRLTTTGVDLGVPADYCLGGACGNVHRVSVCGAVAAACAEGRCAFADPSFTCPPDGLRAPAGAFPDLGAAPADKCAASRSSAGCTPNPRPAYQNTLLLPLALEQPDEPLCPPCDADFLSFFGFRLAQALPGTLRVELTLNPRVAPAVSPDGVWLVDDAGLFWVSLWDRPPLTADDRHLVWELDSAAEGLVGTLRAGQIDFIHQATGRAANPITQLKSEPISVR
jgi:hypothetical protein